RENNSTVANCGLSPGDARSGFVSAGQNVAHTASCVFRWNALQLGMRKKEFFALSESHRMRRDRFKASERGARATDQVVFNRENGLGDNAQIAFEQQVVNTNDRAGQ